MKSTNREVGAGLVLTQDDIEEIIDFILDKVSELTIAPHIPFPPDREKEMELSLAYPAEAGKREAYLDVYNFIMKIMSEKINKQVMSNFPNFLRQFEEKE